MWRLSCKYCAMHRSTAVILWKKARKKYLCLSLCRGSKHGIPEFCMKLYPYSSLYARVLNKEVSNGFVRQTMFCPITCLVTSFDTKVVVDYFFHTITEFPFFRKLMFRALALIYTATTWHGCRVRHQSENLYLELAKHISVRFKNQCSLISKRITLTFFSSKEIYGFNGRVLQLFRLMTYPNIAKC